MKLTRMQKIGVVGFIPIIGYILLMIYNLKTGNFKDWVGMPELTVIFGFILFTFILDIMMLIPYNIKVELTDEEIYLYRKHLRKAEVRFKYSEIIKVYFNYQAYDTAIVFERDRKRYFVNVGGEVLSKHPELNKKLEEKGVKIERATNITYRGHDTEFNKKVNKIRKSCDKVILIYG